MVDPSSGVFDLLTVPVVMSHWFLYGFLGDISVRSSLFRERLIIGSPLPIIYLKK